MGAFIGYRNRVDIATITAPGQTVMPGYPLDNLKSVALSEHSRIVADNDVDIRITFPYSVAVNQIALLGLNFQSAVRASIHVQSSLDGVTWVDGQGYALVDDSELPMPGQLIGRFPITQKRRYYRITGRWDLPVGEEYWKIGAIFVSNALAVPDGVDSGWELGFTDPGSIDYSGGIQPTQGLETITRVLKVPLESLRSTELMFGFADDATSAIEGPSMQGLMMFAGTTGAVLFVPRDLSGLWMYRNAVYGCIQQEWAIAHKRGPRYGASLVVREWR